MEVICQPRNKVLPSGDQAVAEGLLLAKVLPAEVEQNKDICADVFEHGAAVCFLQSKTETN